MGHRQTSSTVFPPGGVGPKVVNVQDMNRIGSRRDFRRTEFLESQAEPPDALRR